MGSHEHQHPLPKRQLLLSLKYSTIEASFSVPMLTLTMSNLAFAISFAAKVLGWSATAIGWMAAVPHICNFLQPPITNLLQRRLSLYQIMLVTFTLSALPWAFVSFFPWFGEKKHLAFALIVLISSLGNAICGVAWSAAISELVPISIRGKYFGKRNLVFNSWALLAILLAGKAVDMANSSLLIFGTIFAAAGAMRMIGLFFLTKMKFPHTVMERHERAATLSEYLSVFRDRDYLPLLLFVGFWGLFLNLGSPFYNVFVLRELRLSVGDLTVLTVLASLGGLVSLKTWGRLADHYGNKPVLFTSSMLWAGTALLSWMFAAPEHYVHLYLNYFLVGFLTAGMQLAQFNLMIKLVPTKSKAHYISVFFSFTSLLTAIGPILGGKILNWLPRYVGNFFGQAFLNYHLLFVGSLFLCFMAVHFLQFVREPAERPIRELVRVMRNMREFNPVIGLTSLVQFVFTPSEITRFARISMRSLRKHKGAVTDVGGELVSGTWQKLKQRLDRERTFKK
jgi:MFS family permease